MYSKSDDKPLNFDVPYFQTAAKCHFFFVVNGRVSSVVSVGLHSGCETDLECDVNLYDDDCYDDYGDADAAADDDDDGDFHADYHAHDTGW